MKYTKEFLLTQNGAEYSAKISGTLCSGVVSVYGGNVYLCQNIWEGTDCPDKKGYKYSWVVYGSRGEFLKDQISDLTLTDKYTLQECKDQEITVLTKTAEQANIIYSHFGKGNLFTLDEYREIGFNSPYDTGKIGYCTIPNWWKEQKLSKKSINFDQLIIEKTPMKEGKIVGYKIIKPEYKEAALKISNTVANWENSLMSYDISVSQKGYIERLEKAGVLNLWFEPVFEQIIPKIGGYEVKKKNKYTATFGCVGVDISQLKGLSLAMRNVISPSSSTQIESIKLSGGIFVTLKELDEVLAYLSTK